MMEWRLREALEKQGCPVCVLGECFHSRTGFVWITSIRRWSKPPLLK